MKSRLTFVVYCKVLPYFPTLAEYTQHTLTVLTYGGVPPVFNSVASHKRQRNNLNRTPNINA